jgi:hypothetical protein
MVELIRTNDTVLLSWLQALLRDSGIESVLLDSHTSIIEGSVGAIPRRLMVADGDIAQARHLLHEAGILETADETTNETPNTGPGP